LSLRGGPHCAVAAVTVQRRWRARRYAPQTMERMEMAAIW